MGSGWQLYAYIVDLEHFRLWQGFFWQVHFTLNVQGFEWMADIAFNCIAECKWDTEAQIYKIQKFTHFTASSDFKLPLFYTYNEQSK